MPSNRGLKKKNHLPSCCQSKAAHEMRTRRFEPLLTFPPAVDTTVTCVVKSSSSSKEGSVMMVPSNTPQVKGKGICRNTNVVGVSGAEKMYAHGTHPPVSVTSAERILRSSCQGASRRVFLAERALVQMCVLNAPMQKDTAVDSKTKHYRIICGA